MSKTSLSKKIATINIARTNLETATKVIQDALNLVTNDFVVESDFSVYVKNTYTCDQYDIINRDWLGEPSRWIQAVAEIMNEQDYPVARISGEQFADFFELVDSDRALIINACATDEQFEEYQNYELRNMNY